MLNKISIEILNNIALECEKNSSKAESEEKRIVYIRAAEKIKEIVKKSVEHIE